MRILDLNNKKLAYKGTIIAPNNIKKEIINTKVFMETKAYI